MSPRISANSPWVCSEPDCQNPVSTPTTLRCRACWAKSEHRRVALSTCAMDHCDAPIRSKGLCERHYRRPSDDHHHKQKRCCQVCAVPINDKATLCRTHYLAAKKPLPTCACGAALSTRKATQCRACWMRDHMAQTSRPTCKGCGTLISWSIGRNRGPATLCKPCYGKQRLENRIVVLREGMNREDLPGVDAPRHIRIDRRKAGPLRELFGSRPCMICGYNRISCHIHRLEAEKGYILGNVVHVCPNCHGEIHAGITPAPEPAVP